MSVPEFILKHHNSGVANHEYRENIFANANKKPAQDTISPFMASDRANFTQGRTLPGQDMVQGTNRQTDGKQKKVAQESFQGDIYDIESQANAWMQEMMSKYPYFRIISTNSHTLMDRSVEFIVYEYTP